MLIKLTFCVLPSLTVNERLQKFITKYDNSDNTFYRFVGLIVHSVYFFAYCAILICACIKGLAYFVVDVVCSVRSDSQ